MSVGSRIKALRLKSKLTQKDIAEKLNMGSSNFGHIENDRVIPTSEALEKIADIFNTTTDYLFGRSIGALIEKQLLNMGKTLEWLSEQTNIPLKNLQNIDNAVPKIEDYQSGGVIDRITKTLTFKTDVLFTAFERQEPPAYDGPRSSIEEDFANIDFDEKYEKQKENSTTSAAEDDDYQTFMDALKAIANQHNYDLRDPEFLDLINKALTFVKSVRRDKVD